MAGTFKVDVDVDISGPLADGTADNALQEWAANTAKALGDEGTRLLKAFPMNKTGRSRGGFQENLHPVQKGPEVTIFAPMIRGITWGPWLEGTSERNRSTRFKGYHLFRKTRQQLQQMAPDIGQAELDKLMSRIGGE